MSTIKNSLNQSHDYIKSIVKQGDCVIDATAGNGNDTLLLAGLVGDTGKVFSFDIQEVAIQKTRAKLELAGILERAQLICDGHENIEKYVNEKIKVAMFNLGYRPGGDHNIHTKFQTTKTAIDSCIKLLALGGMVSIVVYYGGDSGFEEKDCLMEYLKTLNPKELIVMQTDFINQINCPPILICIEKYA